MILKGLKFNSFLAKNCKPSIYRALEKRVESQVENYNYGNKFQLIDQLTRKPLCNIGYKLICDGKITEGRTDQQGYTEFISSDTEADVQLFLINNFEEFEDGSR